MNAPGLYVGFSGLYDRLMAGVDYEAWVDYVEQILALYSKKPETVLDLACGTGSSTLPFAVRGYLTTGIDLSEPMLAIAKHKAEKSNLQAVFYRRNLIKLDLPEQYNLAVLFQDGLNYLLHEEDLTAAFKEICSALTEGSLFIFDLTCPRLRSPAKQGELCWADLKDYTLIWESNYCDQENIWSINLTGFTRTENNLYQKFSETHNEKDYSPGLVSELIGQSGFRILNIYPTFSLEALTGKEHKLTFVAEKYIA